MYRSKSFSTMTLIISIALFSSPAANSASKSPPKPSAKSVKSGSSAHSKLLSNPKSTYKILLDSPVQFGRDEGWRKVSILAPDGKATLVSDLAADEPGCCYQLSENDWSPDGKYLRLIHMIEYASQNSRQDTANILDVGKKEFVDFKSADETSLTYDHTSFEWISTKPHSIEVRSEKTGKLEEALPSQ